MRGQNLSHRNYKEMMKKAVITFAILLLTVLLSLGMAQIGFRIENILMIYVVGVMIVILETKSFLWGAFSTLFCIFALNFFFTEPKYTFMVADPNYYVSFAIFLVVAFIVSTLTTRLQKQIAISRQNEEITNKLYKTSSGYLNITGLNNIIDYGQNSLEQLIHKKCTIYIKTANETTFNEQVLWCYENSMICGYNESKFEKDKNKYMPIRSNHKILGVLSIDCSSGDIKEDEMIYINTMLSQITIAVERDLLNTSEEISRLNIEKEKLKNNLLRSISHDLRTPLTGISGGADFLIDSLDHLDNETIRALLSDISNDATWLGNMVENLLNMMRIQDGKLTIKRENEVVDDIIEAAISRVAKRAGNHIIKTSKPCDIVLVPMDGQLIIQVLVNLLDNAIKHTKDNSEILLSAHRNGDFMIFEVSDNGGGIMEEMKDTIFHSFVTSLNGSGDTRRGMGLGLSICKSIVKAHGGVITADNNDSGGATFMFTLPLEVQTDE